MSASLLLPPLPLSQDDVACVGSGSPPRALLPGSFNPVHAGHWSLAEVASRLLGVPVAFELSLHNVDKPDLTSADVERRVRPFAGKADVWLTRAATFVHKARLFPGAVFVVGADTACRIVADQYYADSAAHRQAARTLADLQCGFLVAARADATGKLQTLADLALPAEWQSLFRSIDLGDFRMDLSSTQLRAKRDNGETR
jgi:hypothetical protein